MSRKRRSDAFDAGMTPEQRDTLVDWLLVDNVSLKEAARLCYAEFDVKVAPSSLSDWLSAYTFRADLRSAVAVANDLKADLVSLDIGLEDETISRAAQAKFEAQIAKTGDVKSHVLLRNTRLREKELAARTAGTEAKLAQRERELAAEEKGFRLKYEQKERELKLSQEKFVASLRSKLEQGLAALLEEIKGNPAAVVIFDRLQAEMEAAQPA